MPQHGICVREAKQSTQLKSLSSCPNTSESSSPVSFDWQCLCWRAWCCVRRMSGFSQPTVCQCTGCRMSCEWCGRMDEGGGSEQRGGLPRQSAASGIAKAHLACGIWLPLEKSCCCCFSFQVHRHVVNTIWESMTTVHVWPLHHNFIALQHPG